MTDKELQDQIEKQQRLVNSIREMQKEEREIRSGILSECFGESTVGSVKTQVGNLIVTGEYGLTYKLAQDEIDDAIQKGLLSDDVMESIRVKYELDKRMYDKLDEDATDEINGYLTITPSLPALKIKTIKED